MRPEGGPSVARIIVRTKNVPGSLAAVATVIGSNGGNIFNLKVAARNPLFFEFLIDIEVRDVAHLQNIIGRAAGECGGRIGRPRPRQGDRGDLSQKFAGIAEFQFSPAVMAGLAVSADAKYPHALLGRQALALPSGERI